MVKTSHYRVIGRTNWMYWFQVNQVYSIIEQYLTNHDLESPGLSQYFSETTRNTRCKLRNHVRSRYLRYFGRAKNRRTQASLPAPESFRYILCLTEVSLARA
jgi:hypothetical protein